MQFKDHTLKEYLKYCFLYVMTKDGEQIVLQRDFPGKKTVN